MIPLSRPSITPAELEAVRRVLETGFLVQGPEVAAFEAELAAVVGTQHVVVVNSGTAALYASLKALGTGPGDLVLVAAYSWIATANVVALCNAQVRFVDIEEGTLGMDPDELAKTLRALDDSGELPRVKAIIPVHVFGLMCDMPNITAVAGQYGIPVVEDAACALGASLGSSPAGSLGHLGCFSFHPRKALTTGEGGAVATDDATLAAFVRSFRNHGQDYSTGSRQFVLVGDNLRMTDFQAALGRTQLARLSELLMERHVLADRYRKLLGEMPVVPVGPLSAATTVQSFVVRLHPTVDRDGLVSYMRSRGIEAAAGTIDMPEAQVFAVLGQACPVTTAVDRTLLTLPLYNGLEHEDQDTVVETLQDALDVVGSR